MFFSKKKEEPANDKLEALKKQLMELKAKEAELDKKAAEKQGQVMVSNPVQTTVQVPVPPQQPVQVAQPQQAVVQQAPQQIQVVQPVVQQPVVVPQPQSIDNNYGITISKVIPDNTEPATVVRDREIEKFVGNVNGVVLEIGSGMSINVPVKPRMNIDEFIRIAERVKALSALNFEHKY